MKKVLLTACLAVVSLTTFAQVYYDDRPVKLGVKIGGVSSVLKQTMSGFSGSALSGPLYSFSVGGFADFKLGEEMSFQPAVLFTAKGGQQSFDYSMEDPDFGTVGGALSAKTTIYYVQVPLNLVYHVTNDYGELFLGAGPYVSYGISGTTKGSASFTIDGESIIQPYNEDVVFGNNDGQVKRIDYGLNAIIGYKFDGGLMLNFNYDFGISPVVSETEPTLDITAKTRNRTVGFSIGYMF